MIHKVKSGKHIILNGRVYITGTDGLVDLPEAFITNDCTPVKNEKVIPAEDAPEPSTPEPEKKTAKDKKTAKAE